MNKRNNNRSVFFVERQFRAPNLFVVFSLLGLAILLAACRQEAPPQATPRPTTAAALATIAPTASPTETDDVPAVEESPVPSQTPGEPESRPSPTPEVRETVSPTPQATPDSPSAEATAPAGSASSGSSNVVRDAAPEGALIAVQMDGQAGVLLDEIPEEMRERVAQSLLQGQDGEASSDPFWEDLARRQVRLTKRRLNFRNFVYDNKGQLPLPPEALWTITLDPAGPRREEVQGHDLLLVDYTFTSTLLSDAESVAETEPSLAETGGTWEEPYILPVDPDLLLQRTGNACLNEAGFPPNSFDSENAWIFYDYRCQPDSIGPAGCHRTFRPRQSCTEALAARVGTTSTEVHFERLEWDEELAGEVRMGEVRHLDDPDLSVVGGDLEDYRITYRYFPEDSCALAELCVGDSGWRRLLQFSATVHNVGAEAMDIGRVISTNPLQNLFQYNSCHDHFHFSDYGDFFFQGAELNTSSKQAFCVESTNRLSNNEWSPLTHPYTCSAQGVQAGWVDEYVAGLDCQWVDITDMGADEIGSSATLGFVSNPNEFLCEGQPVVDEDGVQLWEPSGLTDPSGQTIDRPQCDFVPGWDLNNTGSRELSILPTGSFVTDSCRAGEIGPLRNCGFAEQLSGLEVLPGDDPGDEDGDEDIAPPPEGAFNCNPGRPVEMTCNLESEAAPQVLRVCDYSLALETGTACVYESALANAVVGEGGTEVAFTCPAGRSEEEPGGFFSFYTAPVFGEDEPAGVSCQVTG